ncbi:MAG: hypothetical protein II304_02495 [Bacteroidales bacterium]|nr:hypothetical protein [Bacteroidales bacterium]
MEIKIGDIFENKNGIRIGVIEIEPEADYVCFKIGRNITKDKLDSAHFETRDASIEGLEHCLTVNGYEKLPDVLTESVRLKEDDTAANQEEDPNAQQDPNAAGEDAAAEEPENPVAAEVDPNVQSDEQVELNSDLQQGEAPLKMPSSAPIPNGGGPAIDAQGDPLQLNDGTDTQVAQDSALQFDAINPEGEASIKFESGNFSQLAQMPQKIMTKIATIQKTIMPLAEVALIELLGNNKAFKGENFNAVFNMLDNEPKFECNATYSVELFIGTDIEQADIQHDAKYILDRLQAVPNVQWNRCEIDCTQGKVNLGFIV